MSSIKALIVDDSKSVRFSLRKMLMQYNVEADTVESGAEALDFLKNADKAPCVIFMDHMMPDMDGFETAELMRGAEETKHVPIIFVTAINKEQKHVFKGYEAIYIYPYLVKFMVVKRERKSEIFRSISAA